MKIAVIPADTAKPIEIRDVEEIGLDLLQQAVGGYIELTHYRADSLDGQERTMSIYSNEEGKLDGLPRNARATMMGHHGHFLRVSDYLVGDVVVTGGADDDGEDTGLTEEATDWLTGLDQTVRALYSAE